MAELYALIGDADGAIGELRRALEARLLGVLFLNGPLFDRIRGDARFLDLRRRVGVPG